MTRDLAFAAECTALCDALRPHATLGALQRTPAWKELEPRLRRVLGTLRRHAPPQPPDQAPDPARLMAVQWNIEHGNRFDAIAQALRDHPQLEAADLVFLNEVDLGMARSGNRDVADDLARALGFHGVWAPLFLEITTGRDDDTALAAGLQNQEALFGLAILSRWPIGEARAIELPSPVEYQFDVERMYGRHVGLVAAIERPGEPFVAVSVHLEVLRTRRHRAIQMQTLMDGLAREGRPIILAGDFNSHTFDRGRWWDPLLGGTVLTCWPDGWLSHRLLHPDRGGTRERTFDVLREARFEWLPLNDRRPTLQLRFDRLHEARGLRSALGSIVRPLLARAERRSQLRLDWFAGRDWRRGRGATVVGLDGPGRPSDHAPIVAEFR